MFIFFQFLEKLIAPSIEGLVGNQRHPGFGSRAKTFLQELLQSDGCAMRLHDHPVARSPKLGIVRMKAFLSAPLALSGNDQ